MRWIVVSAAVLAASFNPAASADIRHGLAAYESGDFSAALAEWEPLADEGLAAAQFNLGLLYHTGQGVPKDLETALHWYEQAADRGLPEAQTKLAHLYEYGLGVEADPTKAARMYRRAAEQGLPVAQYNIGRLHHFGIGVRKDGRIAARWYRRAAEQGNTKAHFGLGLIYVEGVDVAVNPEEAEPWLLAAARAGHTGAQARLGYFYHQGGKGGDPDLAKAAEWYERAAMRAEIYRAITHILRIRGGTANKETAIDMEHLSGLFVFEWPYDFDRAYPGYRELLFQPQVLRELGFSVDDEGLVSLPSPEHIGTDSPTA